MKLPRFVDVASRRRSRRARRPRGPCCARRWEASVRRLCRNRRRLPSPPPVAVATSAPESTPTASSVRDWNQHAVTVLTTPSDAPEPGAGQTPPVTMLHLAMVHGAIYDAVNAIEGGYQPFLPGLPAASPSASVDAAVATAAHDVLVGLGTDPPLPEAVVSRLDSLYEEALAAIPDGADKTDGIAVGAAAAAAMLAARAEDGRYVPFSHPVGDQPGEWRPIPPDEVNDPFAWVANVEPFTLDSPSQFRSAGPHRDRQRRVHHRVQRGQRPRRRRQRAQPRAAGHRRLPRQYRGDVQPDVPHRRRSRGTHPRRGSPTVRHGSTWPPPTASINCWDDKTYWHFWRPITAIHEGDNDGNDDTVGDPSWEPMLPTPPYPDHPSGYNCLTGGDDAQRRRLLRRRADRLQPRHDRARRPRGDP